MNSTQQQRKGETAKAYQAYLDYRDMGISRSLKKLLDTYLTHTSPAQCPTTRLGTLEKWSALYKWQERIADYESHLAEERELAAESARIAERETRQRLLAAMRSKIEGQMKLANLNDEKSLRTIVYAWNLYLDQSRKEHNDLPTTRTDVTSAGKAVHVAFNIIPAEDSEHVDDDPEED